jgi:hypothetical protein
MSLAKIYTTKKSRKEWKCGKCGDVIPVGSKVISFAVGFRGREQKRCEKVSCFPLRSDLESSLVSGAYAALEAVDLEGLDSLEEVQAALEEAAQGVEEVVSEYEQNPMYDVNEDLQERVSILEAAASELQSFEPSTPEPELDDYEDDEETYNADYAEFMETVRDEAGNLLDEVELP